MSHSTLFSVPRLRRLLAAASVAASALSGCSTVQVAVLPHPCPEMLEATVLELTDMELKGVYSNTREYVLDQIVPYCAGVEAMSRP